MADRGLANAGFATSTPENGTRVYGEDWTPVVILPINWGEAHYPIGGLSSPPAATPHRFVWVDNQWKPVVENIEYLP